MSSYRRKKSSNSNFGRSAAAMKYYSHGTQAKKVYEEHEQANRKMVRLENKKNKAGSAAKITCSVIICVCALVMIFARSMVYGYQLRNDSLRNELEEAKDKTASIIAQSTEGIDIAYVEEQARTRLNMAKPQSYQIVYIDVPKTDYTVLHNADTIIEKENKALVSYRDIISNILEAKNIIISDREGEK